MIGFDLEQAQAEKELAACEALRSDMESWDATRPYHAEALELMKGLLDSALGFLRARLEYLKKEPELPADVRKQMQRALSRMDSHFKRIHEQRLGTQYLGVRR